MEDTPLRHDDSDATTTTRTENPGANHPTDDVEYTAIISPYDDAPDECTIFPAGLTEAELMTTWVSAQDGAYVSLEAMR